MRRLDEGKVYLPDRAAVAMVNFFREGNLMALRENGVASRSGTGAPGRARLHAGDADPRPMENGASPFGGVSPSPLSAQMVRWTRRLADSLDAQWIGGPCGILQKYFPTRTRTPEQKILHSRAKLGAEVIATVDEDLVHGVLRVARQHNATQIVVGKPEGASLRKKFPPDGFCDDWSADSG